MVECDLAKVEVAGSNPVSRSINRSMNLRQLPLPGEGLVVSGPLEMADLAAAFWFRPRPFRPRPFRPRPIRPWPIRSLVDSVLIKKMCDDVTAAPAQPHHLNHGRQNAAPERLAPGQLNSGAVPKW